LKASKEFGLKDSIWRKSSKRYGIGAIIGTSFWKWHSDQVVTVTISHGDANVRFRQAAYFDFNE
jgi:hypothetical protein